MRADVSARAIVASTSIERFLLNEGIVRSLFYPTGSVGCARRGLPSASSWRTAMLHGNNGNCLKLERTFFFSAAGADRISSIDGVRGRHKAGHARPQPGPALQPVRRLGEVPDAECCRPADPTARRLALYLVRRGAAAHAHPLARQRTDLRPAHG